MTAKVASRTLVQFACVALTAGVVGGCGGGGGGGDATGQPTSSPPTLVITATNSDTVGHFAAVAALSLPISWLSETSVSLTGGGAQSASLQSRVGVLRALGDRFGQAGAGRRQGLELMDTGELPCNFGGTMAITINDVDNNGAETAGDVETVQFNNCMGALNETYNGAVRIDVIEVAGESATYNVTLTRLSYITPNHSLTFNGSYVANQGSTADSVQTTVLTVNEAVTVDVATHVGYTDTVMLGRGFTVQDQIDYGAGRNVLSVDGRVESVLAGGSVDVSTHDVSTLSDLITTRTGLAGGYPERGVLHVKGKVGALSITALSSASVCLDADTNDDRAIEWSHTQSWDWLM